MSLQPPPTQKTDRKTTTPFLLRLFWRLHSPYTPSEFSVAPPADTSNIIDYASLLPPAIRQQSVQIYTWPTCTLQELTGLLCSVLPEGVLRKDGGVGTRLVYKLIFPDTRGGVSESGRGKWVDRPLGSVVIGAKGAAGIAGDHDDHDDHDDDGEGDDDEDDDGMNGDTRKDTLEGDAGKTLADARFVIGDYIACTIYPPTADGRVAPAPSMASGRGPRDPYMAPRGGHGLPPPPRENGYGYGAPRGGRGGRGGGFGAAPPPGDWRRGERPPGYGGGGGGGYRGRGGGGRPY